MLYNPFSKPVENITAKDLQILTEVSEGWFVDYKREAIKIKDFAKHISAFTNQYGGFLFIGIQENKEQRTASKFTGVNTSDVSDILLKIREAASAHIQPTPEYRIKVLNGPEKSIDLKEGKSIIIVSIFQGSFPPYIHSWGKIYRRIDDQSKPEKDRYELDKLWERGKNLEEDYRQFLQDRPYFDNEEVPRILIYFLTDPTIKLENKVFPFQDFQSVMTSELKDEGFSIPFDTVYSTSTGFVARQHEENDPNQDVLTFHWRRDGNGILEIPLNTYPQHKFQENLDSYKNADKFIKLIYKKGFSRGSIIDFNYVLKTLAAGAFHYLKLLELADIEQKLYLKARILNIGGMTPFIDSIEYYNEIEKWGVPVVKENNIWCPNGLGLNDLSTFEVNKDNNILNGTAALGGQILMAVGVLRDIENSESLKMVYLSAFNAN